jgi:catalase
MDFASLCTGPVLLEDLQTVERVMDLTKERIPARRVHAQGTVAKGFFEARPCYQKSLGICTVGRQQLCNTALVLQVTDNITDLTFADVFAKLHQRTDVIVRFSTVTGGAGSPEWLRDPRGFAVRPLTSLYCFFCALFILHAWACAACAA